MRSRLSRIRGSLLKGESLRGMGIMMAGTGGAQLIVIAASPLLTRLYSPADYGLFAVAQAVILIVATIITLRYAFAIPIAVDDRAVANLFALSIGAALAVTATATVVILVVLPVFDTEVGDLAPYLPLLAVAMFADGIIRSFTGLATRQKAYSAIAQNRFTVGVGTLATQLILGWQGWGTAGLLTGLAGGSIAGTIRYIVRDFRSKLDMFRLVSAAGVVEVARRYWRFPIVSAPSALLNGFGRQLPLLLFVALYGAVEGGLLALASRVMSAPFLLVSQAVAYTYHADAAQVARENPRDVRDVFLRTTRTLALILSVPTLLAMVLAPLLFETIFGAEWAEAGLYVSILAPASYLHSVFGPTGTATLDVLERQGLHFTRELIRIMLLASVFFVAASAGLPAIVTVAAISVAGCIAYVCYGAVSWWAIVTAERQISQ